MRFFKSCRRVKQTRAREMLFRSGFIRSSWCPLPSETERRLQKKAPENPEPEANPLPSAANIAQQSKGYPRYGVTGSRLESCPQLSITERQV